MGNVLGNYVRVRVCVLQEPVFVFKQSRKTVIIVGGGFNLTPNEWSDR